MVLMNIHQWAGPRAGGAGLTSRVKFSAENAGGAVKETEHGPGPLHPPVTDSLGARGLIRRSSLPGIVPFSLFFVVLNSGQKPSAISRKRWGWLGSRVRMAQGTDPP